MYILEVKTAKKSIKRKTNKGVVLCGIISLLYHDHIGSKDEGRRAAVKDK
jgi:hypothetical protein